MIPTYISTTILKPGARYSFGAEHLAIPSAEVPLIDSMLGGIYYSVTRDKIVPDGEELVADDGALAEILFMVTSITEVDEMSNGQYPWLVDHIANAGYTDLEAGNMKALYEVASSLVAGNENDLIIHVSFLGGWTTETTYLREEGYSEISAVNFAGRCKVVLDGP